MSFCPVIDEVKPRTLGRGSDPGIVPAAEAGAVAPPTPLILSLSSFLSCCMSTWHLARKLSTNAQKLADTALTRHRRLHLPSTGSFSFTSSSLHRIRHTSKKSLHRHNISDDVHLLSMKSLLNLMFPSFCPLICSSLMTLVHE